MPIEFSINLTLPIHRGISTKLTLLCRMNQVWIESNGGNEEILATAYSYPQFHEHPYCDWPKLSCNQLFSFPRVFILPLVKTEIIYLAQLANDD